MAMKAVEKYPAERTEEDCRVIRDVMRTLSSFRKYTEDMQFLLSRVVRYCR